MVWPESKPHDVRVHPASNDHNVQLFWTTQDIELVIEETVVDPAKVDVVFFGGNPGN